MRYHRTFLASFFSLIVLFPCLLPSPASADLIYLKNGKFFAGSMTTDDENPLLVSIELGGGFVKLPKNCIDRVEKVNVEGDDSEPLPPMEFGKSVGLKIISKKQGNGETFQHEDLNTGDSRFAVVADPVDTSMNGTGVPVHLATAIRMVIGKVTDVKGKAEIKSADQTWKPLQNGDTIVPGDEVRTLEGRVKLFTADSDELRLRENTHIKNPEGEVKPVIDLIEGRLWAKVRAMEKKGEEKISIRTPNAVAGVRGTLLFVETGVDGDTLVAVFNGRVAVSKPDDVKELTTLSAEQATSVRGSGTVAPARYDSKWINEWTFWDNWQAEVEDIAKGFVFGGNVIAGLGAQIAHENKMFEQQMQEYKVAKTKERAYEALEELKQAVLAFCKDVGRLPTTQEGFSVLKYNNVNSPTWRGPYIPQDRLLPLKDGWQNKVVYEVRKSQKSGIEYAVIISPGPDKIYSQGKPGTDDLMVNCIPSQ